MLLYEKYLLKINKNKYTFPLIESNGIIAYELDLENRKKVFFIKFTSSSQKNNLIKYNFKYFETKSDSYGCNYLNNYFNEVDYNNYFSCIENIKIKIKKEKHRVAASYDEFFCMIWKSFLMINDEWFSENYSKLSGKIFDTIDDNLSFSEKTDNINEIINSFKTNFYQIYYGWTVHISNFSDVTHLKWFNEFVEN
jgi:hypothetical protein